MAKRKKLNFPKNSSEIVEQIMKEFNIEETEEEIMEKIKKGETTQTRKLVNIVRKAKKEKLENDKIAEELMKEFNFSKKKATNLAKEVSNKLLYPQREEEKEQQDSYREPIE